MKRSRSKSPPAPSCPSSDSDAAAGPAAPPGSRRAQKRSLPGQRLYLAALPRAALYRLSYMHRDVVTHVLAAPRRGFLVSASVDGQIKFWARSGYGGGAGRGAAGGLVGSGGGRGKDEERPLEFVKQFRAHVGKVDCMALSSDGGLLVTVCAADRTAKVFSVDSFDMLGFARLGFDPGESVVWVEERRNGVLRFAVAMRDSPKVAVFDPEGLGRPPRVLRLPHLAPVVLMKFNLAFEAVVSIDGKGIIEYWMVERLGKDTRRSGTDGDANDGEDGASIGHENQKEVNKETNGEDESSSDGLEDDSIRTSIPGVTFEFKGDTNLYEFMKAKTRPTSLHISPDGTQFVCAALDRVVRVFYFRTGKLRRSYNESLDAVRSEFRARAKPRSETEGTVRADEEGEERNQTQVVGVHGDAAAEADFTRRIEREREVASDTGAALCRSNAVFDASGHFVVYATVLGIKIVNLVTNVVSRTLGRWEGAERFLTVALFQEVAGAAPNAAVRSGASSKVHCLEPLLVATSFDSQRIFLFSRTEPPEGEERDVFNEKPRARRGSNIPKDISPTKPARPAPKLAKRVTLHTTSGDITFVTLEHAPRALENFTVHASNHYFDNVIFHRCIKGFMVQTGDPKGDGTGGECIWGEDFENEIDESVKHGKGAVSMANAGGRRSQGSQFFITTVATPHLDGKHTIFGRVVKGMSVVHQIESAKVDKNDRPVSDISIVSISMQFGE